MNFEERLAQTQIKLEELKAKINESMESAKKAGKANRKEAMINLAKMDAAIEKFGKDVEAQVYCDVTSLGKEAQADAEAVKNALGEIDDKIIDKNVEAKEKVEDNIATVEGSAVAAEENFRIAKDRYNSKLNANRLKVQMHQEEIKNRIESKKTELDKAAQEELIMDLLDYADDCQMVAYAYAMEAELAILDACDQIDAYEAKFGEFKAAEE